MSESRRLTQDEIISNTKNVLRGLEALKDEHSGLLNKFQPQTSKMDDKLGTGSPESEKKQMIQKSLEKIELGLGEAQVKIESVCTSLFIWFLRVVKQLL